MVITPLRHFAGRKSLFAGISSLFAGKGGPLFPAPSFARGFSDLGAGAVDLGANSTFTRATSATCWGPTGLLLTVGTGVARSTYTELTGATYLGYLSEEARTNNCIQNRDFTNAAWVMTTMTPLKDQVGIDGVANSASSLLATGANATAAQTVTIAAVNRPFSVYVKRLVGTGNIDLAQDGASFTTQSVANDGLWHRCTLVASQLNPVLTIRLATNADKIAVDYAMLEDSGGAARTFPLSPIATVAAAVTRNIDNLTFPRAGNILDAQGTMYAESVFPTVVPASVFAISGGGGSTSGPLAKNNNGKIIVCDATAAHAVQSVGVVNDGLSHKCVAVWDSAAATRLNAALDGVMGVAVAYGGTMGSSPLPLGSGTAGQFLLNGTIKNVKIWTVALSDGQIAAL